MWTRSLSALALALGLLACAVAGPAAARPLGQPYELSLTGTDPRLAFNSQDGRYLVSSLFVGHGFSVEVHLADVAGSGAPGERAFPFAGVFMFNDDLAYDASRNRYLVAYPARPSSLGQEGPDAVYGELRASDGSVVAGRVVLKHGYGTPAVAYDPRHDQYLLIVVPEEDPARLVGVRVDGDLHALGPPFLVSHRPDVEANSDPDVVYRPAARDFVVTWIGRRSGGGSSVYAQRVSAGGTPFGPEDLPVSSDADARGVDGQGLAASSDNVDAVVAWGSAGTVYARRLGQRLPRGPLRRISGPADTGGNPAVAYQPRAREWLVAWNGLGPESPADDDGNPVEGIFGQHMSTYLMRKLGPASFPISETLSTTVPEGPPQLFHAQRDPAIAADSTSRNYLVAWDADYQLTAGQSRIEMRRVTAEPPR